jgi:hypothetical protein
MEPPPYGFAFGMTCRMMNPLPVGKYTQPPNPSIANEPIFLDVEVVFAPDSVRASLVPF